MLIDPVGRTDEFCHKLGSRCGIDILRRAILFYFSSMADSDCITHTHSLDLVMRDENACDSEIGNQISQLYAHFFPKQCIQRRKRFIEQDAGWLNDNGACKGHALLLSAGKLVREPVGEVIQTNRVQGITNLFIQAVGTIGRAQTKRNIFVYIHVWPKRKVLKDKTQTTLFRGNVELLLCREHAAFPKQYFAAVGCFQSCNHAQQCSLSAAGGSQQRGKAAAMDSQVRWLYHSLYAECFCYVF